MHANFQNRKILYKNKHLRQKDESKNKKNKKKKKKNVEGGKKFSWSIFEWKAKNE